MPSQSLEINSKMLHSDYKIPTGWNGYGVKDLEALVKLGVLKIVSDEVHPKIRLIERFNLLF